MNEPRALYLGMQRACTQAIASGEARGDPDLASMHGHSEFAKLIRHE
jgi:hypothetical protein